MIEGERSRGWTNPVNADFAKVQVYINGAFKEQVTFAYTAFLSDKLVLIIMIIIIIISLLFF